MGFSLVEMLVVLILISAMAAFIMPRVGPYRDRLNVDSARQQVESGIATARAAAVQKGYPAWFTLVNNRITVTATINAAGQTRCCWARCRLTAR